MTPGHPRILTCPHCGAEKEVLSLASGNTFGQRVWSDNKAIAPMLPRVSFVQQCPKCGGYFLLSRQTEHRYAEKGFGGDSGDLTYPQLKEAFASFRDEELTDDERQAVLLYIVWAFNDTYARHETKEIPQEEQSYIREVIAELLPLISDPLFRAEFYRELGDFDLATEELSKTTQTGDWYLRIKDAIASRIAASDSRVFELTETSR